VGLELSLVDKHSKSMVDVEWALSQLEQVFHFEAHFKLVLGDELAQMYGTE
jgi:hypothetical protein